MIESALQWRADGISVFSGDDAQYRTSPNKNDLFHFARAVRQAGLESQVGMPGGEACIHETKDFEKKGDNADNLRMVFLAAPDVVCTNVPTVARDVAEALCL